MKRRVVRQKKLNVSSKNDQGGISNRLTWANAKKTAIYVYVAVVALTSYGLYSVLKDDTLPSVAPAPEGTYESVVAVLESMDGVEEVQIPIQELDNAMPIPREPAWRLNAVLSSETGKQPVVAVVIDDLGLSEEASLLLAQMQGPYTLAYLPYADNLPDQTALVRAAGHELMVHLPMQPKNDEADPGANALLSSLSQEEFDRRVNWNLSRFQGYVGINNHMGSELTEDAGAMVRVMVKLREGGHLFLDSLTSPKSVGVRAAKATGVPYIARDIFLDNIREASAIEEQLQKLERIARMRGYAIAIGHPYDITLETLTKWEETLKDKEISLVPLSEIVSRQERVRHDTVTAR